MKPIEIAPTLIAIVILSMAARGGDASAQKTLEIGQWDGVTERAELAGPYEDPLQQEIPFGRRSYYLSPWRAYMDTWPASRFLDCLGINFNLNEKQAEPTAQVLAEAGIQSARVEIGWGSLNYENPDVLPASTAARLTIVLQALQKHGIRPLILLNANSGWPCPIKGSRVKLMKPAEMNAREIFVDKTAEIKPGYSGLRGIAYPVGFPLIIRADSESGRCELSAPLAKAIKEGPLEILTLRYQPFAGMVLSDGTPNPAGMETAKGWIAYAACVCKFVKATLAGAAAENDCGFDLEVWNEYSFGSQFLEDKNYYNPSRAFKESLSYSNHGLSRKGTEVILAMTVDYVNDKANSLPGVRVISGFSNQRPFDNGVEMWPGQAGFSRHYYTGMTQGNWDGGSGKINTETLKDGEKKSGPVDALGKPEGKPDGKDWHTVVPGTFFVPSLQVVMPEFWHYGYKTELMTRDVQPFPNPFKNHFRYGHPQGSGPAEVWMTEFNIDRDPWAKALMSSANCAKDDPRLIALLHHTAAKALLRSFIFHSHKGVHTIDVFAAHDTDFSLGVLPESYFKTLLAEKYMLNEQTRNSIGPQLEALKRLSGLMKTGKRIETARPLSVGKLVELKPRLVFKGDGTPAHPDRWNRDDFACLPFQLDAGLFAVGYYVVTRDMTHIWRDDAGMLDASRYDMPEQLFELTLNNVRGTGAKVSLFDPMSGAKLPVEILAQSESSLTVRLPACDYPRCLMIEEDRPGTLILSPRLTSAGNTAKLTFTSNVNAPVKITWGAIPMRTGSGEIDLPAAPAAIGQAQGSEGVERVLEQSVDLSPVKDGDAVQITVSHNGLIARWPIWGHDTRGVLGLENK